MTVLQYLPKTFVTSGVFAINPTFDTKGRGDTGAWSLTLSQSSYYYLLLVRWSIKYQLFLLLLGPFTKSLLFALRILARYVNSGLAYSLNLLFVNINTYTLLCYKCECNSLTFSRLNGWTDTDEIWQGVNYLTLQKLFLRCTSEQNGEGA